MIKKKTLYIWKKRNKTTENRKCIWLQLQHIFEIYIFSEIPVFFPSFPRVRRTCRCFVTSSHTVWGSPHLAFWYLWGQKGAFQHMVPSSCKLRNEKRQNASKSLSHRGQILKHAQHNELLLNKTDPNHIVIPCFCQNVNTTGPLCALYQQTSQKCSVAGPHCQLAHFSPRWRGFRSTWILPSSLC